MPPVKKKQILRRRHYLKEWREFRGLSLEQASERMEIHHSTLSRIENSKSPYNQDFLERAALAYGCDPVDFLKNDPTRPITEVEKAARLLSKAPPEQRAKALEILQVFLDSVA